MQDSHKNFSGPQFCVKEDCCIRCDHYINQVLIVFMNLTATVINSRVGESKTLIHCDINSKAENHLASVWQPHRHQ